MAVKAKPAKRRRQEARPSKTRSGNTLPPIPVRAVDFVMYSTEDMKATRAFYQELFGLKRGEEWDDFWSEFDTSPVTLCLDAPGKWQWQGPAAIALAVRDVHAAIRECRKRKVKIL